MLEKHLQNGGGLDLEDFRDSKSWSSIPSMGRVKNKTKSIHIDGEFLRGPVPLKWLTPACRAGGKILNTALAIWFEYGRTGKPQVTLTTKILERFGIGRKGKYAAIERLQELALIQITYSRTGVNPTIEIVF